MRVRTIAVSLAICIAVASPTLAEPTDRSTAIILFDEAERLYAEGKYAEACPKFAESNRMDPQLGALLHLADCYEKAGKTASAWGAWREAADVAETKGDPRVEIAREHASRLEPHLPRLTLALAPEASADGLEVRRDGVVVGPALFGSAVPVDAGDHVISATARGRKPWTANFTVGEGQTIVATIPALAPAEAPPPAVAPAPVPAPAITATPAAAPSLADSRPGTGWGTQKVLAVSIGGVGLVAASIGGYVALAAKSKYDDAGKYCVGGNTCSEPGLTDRRDAVHAETPATILVVAGAAATAAGIVLWFTAPSEERKVGVHPSAGPGFASVEATGTW